jgi:diphthamide biosynthesis methyltransferase
LVLRRDPIPCNVPKLLEAIAEARVAIEINGDPMFSTRYRCLILHAW